ncbi:MAG: YEATS-associated helix-containing protein [Betaproteobacteria bacterium]
MATELQSALQVTPPSGAIDSHMLIIFGIMVLAGLLGGLANFFLSERQGELGRREWLKYPILGVVAALTVPLFLNMISSTLLEGARTKPIDFYVFSGFCLIYTVASRRLFENVAIKLMTQIDQVKREMNVMKQLRDAAAEAPIKEEKTEVPEIKPDPRESLSYSDIEILRALSEESYVYGNLASLCDKTRLARELVSQRLMVMKAMGVIDTRINEKNVLHWSVSPRGKQVLGEILAGEDKKVA